MFEVGDRSSVDNGGIVVVHTRPAGGLRSPGHVVVKSVTSRAAGHRRFTGTRWSGRLTGYAGTRCEAAGGGSHVCPSFHRELSL